MGTTKYAKPRGAVSSTPEGTPATPGQASKNKRSAKPASRAGVPVTASAATGASMEKMVKAKPTRMVKHSVALLETEHDAMMEMKQRLTEALGQKVKKSDLIRAALRLLLNQSHAKVKAELAKFVATKTAAPKKDA